MGKDVKRSDNTFISRIDGSIKNKSDYDNELGFWKPRSMSKDEVENIISELARSTNVNNKINIIFGK
jgi:hypothetical protein